MKKLLTLLIFALFATTLHAEELWVSGTRANWINREAGILTRLVELTNYATNDIHTVANTNNMKWQISFCYINDASKDVWLWGYTTQKIGGWGVDNEWVKIRAFCDAVNGMECRKGIGLGEYMSLKNLTKLTNNWKVLNIPFIDDNQKAQKRKVEFRRKKK